MVGPERIVPAPSEFVVALTFRLHLVASGKFELSGSASWKSDAHGTHCLAARLSLTCEVVHAFRIFPGRGELIQSRAGAEKW